MSFLIKKSKGKDNDNSTIEKKLEHLNKKSAASSKKSNEEASLTSTSSKRSVLSAIFRHSKDRLRSSLPKIPRKKQTLQIEHQAVSSAATSVSETPDEKKNENLQSVDLPSTTSAFSTPVKNEALVEPQQTNDDDANNDANTVPVCQLSLDMDNTTRNNSPTSVVEMRNMPLFVRSTDTEDCYSSGDDDDDDCGNHIESMVRRLDLRDMADENDDMISLVPMSSGRKVSTFIIHSAHENDDYDDDDDYDVDDDETPMASNRSKNKKLNDCISSAVASATMQTTTNIRSSVGEENIYDDIIDEFSCESMMYDAAQSEWRAKFSREEGDDEDMEFSILLQLFGPLLREGQTYILDLQLFYNVSYLTNNQKVAIRHIYESVLAVIKSTIAQNEYQISAGGAH